MFKINLGLGGYWVRDTLRTKCFVTEYGICDLLHVCSVL